jgi:hypothetical protein
MLDDPEEQMKNIQIKMIRNLLLLIDMILLNVVDYAIEMDGYSLEIMH